jgi:hypothetical protein
MPQTVIFLEDLGPGEKGIAEMLAPVLIRRLTLCFLIVSITQGSPAFTVAIGAWMGGPKTHHWVVNSGFGCPGNLVAFQCFPQEMGQCPRGSFLWEHSLLKMACLSTLKACAQVWTLTQGNLSEHCDQSLLLFNPSSFPFPGLSFPFLSPYYSI